MKRADLLATVRKSATRFGFFELGRALEQLFECSATPAASPDDEVIAFTQAPGLSYPLSDVVRVTYDKTVNVALTFMGLLGTASPLSPEWSEDLLLTDDDGALQAFYDAFHHRAASFLFLAWRTHASDGAFDLEGKDLLSARLRSLAGVDAWSPTDADPLSPMLALGLADHQHGQTQLVDRESAEKLLQRLFPDRHLRLEVRVRRSVSFTPDERAKLGVKNSKLDGGLVYGSACDDDAGLVRIHLGPVDAETYEGFMPGGADYAALERVASRVFGAAVDVELEVHVNPAEVPTAALGAALGARLGVDARYATEKPNALSVRVPLVAGTALAARTFVLHPTEGV